MKRRLRTAEYLRKSRAESLQDSTEETVKRHRDTLDKIAVEMDLDVRGVYEEVKSGEDLYVRTEMLRMLSDIENGKYDAVLCMDIDRLGRGNMSQQGMILETLKQANVKIITPQKVYDLNDESDEEYTEFQTFFARRELKVIKKRMRRGIQKTIEEGGYIANAPFGYEKNRMGKLPTLQIIDDEATYVRRMFEMYAAGHGCPEIAKVINSSGARPRRGAAFNRTTVMAILRNPVYIGKISWNRQRWVRPRNQVEKHQVTSRPRSEWIECEGKHPAIVSEELFMKVQEIAEGRYHPPYNTGKIVNPLAGLITCANCGGKMQYRGFANGDAYLLCSKPGCCQSTQFQYVEEGFLRGIREQLAALETQAKLPADDLEELRQSLGQVEQKISRIKAQKSKLYDLLEGGVYTVEIFRERANLADDKLQEAEEYKETLKRKIADRESFDPAKLAERIRNALDAYGSATPGERNQMLKLIVQEATYYKERGWAKDYFLLNIKLKITG